jgi:hypothetical protein
MSPASFFSHDIQQEQILGKFLDDVYDRLGIHFERVGDKDMQNRGVDIVVTKDDRRFFVDEKAQLDYVGVSMPTFAFEIGGFKDEYYKIGWLFDEKKLTTHYMLVTDIFLKEGTHLTTPEDIASVHLLWISRAKLLEFLDARGFDRAHCELVEQEAREKKQSGKIPTEQRGLYFFLSDQKAEAPFNLVIRREHLLKIGTQIFPKISAGLS